MSLIDFVQKIQKKPRRVRIQFLWASVFICMFLVITIWVISLKHSLLIEDDNKKENISISDDMISLKDAFKASIGAFFEKEIEDQNKIIEQVNESNKAKPAKLPLSQ
ncbi:MAG: hypothetical protein ABIG88_02955 [Patescibacteria group bacterium]|nr:hypothetical protein [Patescibacteria group bacterium]